MVMLHVGLGVTSCGKNDYDPVTRQPNGEIYGNWKLDGYVNNGTFVRPEGSGMSECFLSLEEDGSFNGRICNWFQGEYTFNRDGEFRVIDCVQTLIWSSDSTLMFMEDQIINIKSFRLENNKLNLYYSDNDYLRYSR